MKSLLSLLTALLLTCSLQPSYAQNEDRLKTISSTIDDLEHSFDIVNKKLEDILWYNKVGDVAFIDKVRLAGPPKAVQTPIENPFHDALLDNDLLFWAYIFFPLETRQEGKYPLVVFPHGGVHGTWTTGSAHIIRELVAQGYIVVAPDYRGSIGYGKSFYRAIDYGGLENEDVLASVLYMIENYSIIDTSRVGLLGWSHGGMISLMNALKYPDLYACAYAGVP
ncbi:MAG: alpha/beta fold hydrolase, partial [Bacteroidales bacterium]|nr:alpha/beta fold hydrolase [Bacteroidales bacterium]